MDHDGISTVPVKKTLRETYVEPVKTYTLRILTWNIWCEDQFAHERTAHIIRYLKKMEADVICLQEVTDISYPLIKQAMESSYEMFQIFIDENASYGMCLLCRKKTTVIASQPYYYDFDNTSMGRRVIGCEVEHLNSNLKFHVLNTHLESMKDNDHVRVDQFEVINKVSKQLKYCFLAGDLNSYSPTEELEQKIDSSKFYDSWIAIGCPAKIKYTYNHRRNVNIKGRQSTRFDRILCNNHNVFHVKSMSLIGCDDISETVPMPASDHYGLVTDYEINN